MSIDPDPPAPNQPAPHTGPAPESYRWPLVAVVIAIMPQVLIPARNRVGPPSLVPVLRDRCLPGHGGHRGETRAGPTQRPSCHPGPLRRTDSRRRGGGDPARGARPRRRAGGRSALSADRLLIAGGLVLMVNVITFGLFYWQLDGGGPMARAGDPAPYPDFQFPQTSTSVSRPRAGDHGSPTISTWPSPAPWPSAPPTRCR